MKLVVIDSDGQVEVAVDDIDDFDLSKPFAQADIINGVLVAIETLRANSEEARTARHAVTGE